MTICCFFKERESHEVKRRVHQQELAQKKQEEGLQRFANGKDGAPVSSKPAIKKFESYKKDALMPRTSDLKVT